MISEQVWNEGWTMLCERFNKKFSVVTTREYLLALSEKLDDRAFISSCRQSFRQDEFFPSPQRLIDLGATATPTTAYALPESIVDGTGETVAYPKAFEDMNEEEKAAQLEAIAKFREHLKTAHPAFAKIGIQIAQSSTAVKSLEQHVAQKRQWMRDPVMKKEAMLWAMDRKEELEFIMDGMGNIVDFEVKEDSRNSGK